MSTIAKFRIMDYDGSMHNYYRFSDGYPDGMAGVFANFPLGDHDFILETYVRRLGLEVRNADYWTDFTYVLNLSDRTLEISSCCEGYGFKGSFEEAIRHFWDKEYSEKEGLSLFPREDDMIPILVPGFLKGMRVLINTLSQKVSCLKSDIFCPEILYIGDNINFYMYEDFIFYPQCAMNVNPQAMEDAFCNARRVGVRVYFKNTMSGQDFSLLYMLDVRADGYLLPLTQRFVRYEETLCEETKAEELEILVEYLNTFYDLRNGRALNVMPGIYLGQEIGDIRESVRKRHMGESCKGNE